MAILPNSDNNKVPVNNSVPTTSYSAQPKAITIEQYLQRQQRKQEAKLTAIPKTEKPKHKRGGRIVRLRKQLADLKRTINNDPPPPWHLAAEMWQRVEIIEAQLFKNK